MVREGQIALFLAFAFASCAATCESGDSGDILNVFIVAHSHDDPGWLRSIGDYYNYEVEYIISSVTEELGRNTARKFIQVEVAFLRIWWANQTPETKETFKKLVSDGQLHLVLGGESMPDEAASDFEALIHNLASGHEFIEENFGPQAVPKVSWHIDPFGHSSSTASVYSRSGFSGMILNRVDFRKKEEMKSAKTLEFLWEVAPNKTIFTHVLDSHYCTPDGFDWEHGVTQELPQGDGPPPVIQQTGDNFPWEKSTAAEVAENFVKMVEERRQWYRTNNLLIPFGCDFGFQNARMKYFNMDKLMSYINERPQKYNMCLRYSSVSDYVQSLTLTHASSFPIVDAATVDFFPYADGPVPWIPAQAHEGNQGYWTGFYTSRPGQKGIGRQVESLLTLTESILSLALLNQGALAVRPAHFDALKLIRQESAVFQHHDAVTGTERNVVMIDYGQRLAFAKNKALEILADVSPSLIGAGEFGDTTQVAVFNPLGWERRETVSIFVPNANVRVATREGKPVPQQVVKTWRGGDIVDGGERNISEVAPFTLMFEATVGPASLEAYTLSEADVAEEDSTLSRLVSSGSSINLGSFNISLRVDDFLVLSKSGESVAVQVVVYNASRNATQPSGAYIFRPASRVEPEKYCSKDLSYSVVEGQVGKELRVECSEPLYFLSLCSVGDGDSETLEIAHSIGPLVPGHEVALRYSSSIQSEDKFETDTNGLRLMKRERTGPGGREGDAGDGTVIAANMYPVNSGIILRDHRNLAIGVFVGRPVAATSMHSGVIDILLHRRLDVDDYRGVREPLNDASVANGRHRLILATSDLVDLAHRKNSLFIRHPLEALLLPQSQLSRHSHAPVLCHALPQNINLLTLAPNTNAALSSGVVGRVHLIVRLHHIFGPLEHLSLSKSVELNLENLFELKSWNVEQIEELDIDCASRSRRPSPSKIEIEPLDIRTFLFHFTPISQIE